MKLITLLLAFAFVFIGQHPAVSETFENGLIEVYISTHKDLSQNNYVLEKEIVRFINEAKVTLDIAVQELRSGKINTGNPIKDAVLMAASRGVKVNLILEKSYLRPGSDNQETFDEFIQMDNILVKADSNPAIFHDKFVVRDYDQPTAALLTGSTNFTDTGTRRNYNHIIILHLKNQTQKNYDLLRSFKNEFIEMWDGTFGNINDGQMGSYRIGNTRIKVLFSPDNDPDDYLLETIVAAKESLDIMMFTFGSNSPLIAGVINRFQAVKYINHSPTDEPKIKVRVGMEQEQCKYWSAYPTFKKLGVPVKTEKTSAKLHHKVGIIDKKIVVLGSYNWTLSANVKNDENALVISNPEIAELFTDTFEELWNNVLVEGD